MIDGKSETKEFPTKIMKNHDEIVPGLLIKDYYQFINFDKFPPLEKKIKGKFIIGDLPHNIYPEKYNKDL